VYQRHYRDVDTRLLYKGILLAACSVLLTAAGVMGMAIYLLIRQQLADTIVSIRNGQHRWWSIVIASVLGTYLAMLFWLGGFKYANASVASVLNETANMFIVLMAWLFLKEKLTRRKVVGALLTFFGVVLFLGLIHL